MAEAGPCSPSRTPCNSPSPSTKGLKQSRIRFPVESDASSVGESRADPIGLGPPPFLHKSLAGQMTDSAAFSRLQDDARRRVRSADASSALSPLTQLERGGSSRNARMSHQTRRSMRKGRSAQNNALSDGRADFSQSSAFSDEYDLYPRIIEDVQRAIRLKQRREARMRSHSVHGTRDAQHNNDTISQPLISSPLRMPDQNPSTTATSSATGSVDSEVDFSPSVGTAPLHPVPSSANCGVTLDWAGSASEDDRDKRWPLHLPKRKRDKYPTSSNRAVIEKQETLYADKLARITSKAIPLTLRKAEMTRNQLERRYRTLNPSRGSHLNLLDVARWYNGQGPAAKASLDKAEPLTWLKHLADRRPAGSGRLPWHLTALIIDEYAKTRATHLAMATIPEHDVAPRSPSLAASHHEPISPSSGSWSWNPSPNFLDASTRRRSSDQEVSFGPYVESGRDSIGAESRPSSEGFTRYWRHSLPGGTESAPSSVYSSKHPDDSSHRRHHFRNLAKRIRGRAYDSEDALSSRRNSISEQSASEDAVGKAPRSRPDSGPSSARLQRQDASDSELERNLVAREHVEVPHEEVQVAAEVRSQHDTGDGTPRADGNSVPNEPPTSPTRHAVPRRRIRTSLPSSRRILREENEKRRGEFDEANQRRQYQQRSQILQDARTQNHRTQQMLQHVAASMREYDSVQSSMGVALGIPVSRLPSDVLEAFSRDPSTFTSGTRHSRGWRAVEDVHDRIHRQRKTLHDFVKTIAMQKADPETPSDLFEHPMTSLTTSLARLEQHRERVTSQLEKVTELLISVRQTHKSVKRSYNDTLAHTSLVYPELSHAVVLEESYRNHYQQLWEIGLDALTLLLDTVTPFWRNYGKVIGKDVQDFLIIPWYRNEFTGEAKRYPIKEFPRRSFRHWVGLLSLSFISLCVTLLQARAAYGLTLNWCLPWITHVGLWWLVFPVYCIGLLIQWSAVVIESCILIAQSGVVVWWMGWTVKIFT